MYRLIFNTLLIFCLGLATPLQAETNDDKSAAKIYQAAKQALNNDQLESAISQYSQLRRLYPLSPYATQAQLETSYAYYRVGDAQAATEVLKRFIRDNPDHPHQAYAHYLAGLTLYEEFVKLADTAVTRQGIVRATVSAQQALSYFSKIIDRYPASPYVEDARSKSTHLLEKLVMHRMKHNNQHAAADTAPNKRDTTWLLAQPATYYTLQILSNAEQAEVEKTVAEFDISTQTITYKTITDEGDRYTLLYGLYPNKRTALDAGTNLPTAILNTRPWVREVGSVQADIRENRLQTAAMSTATIPSVIQAPTSITDKSSAPATATATTPSPKAVSRPIAPIAKAVVAATPTKPQTTAVPAKAVAAATPTKPKTKAVTAKAKQPSASAPVVKQANTDDSNWLLTQPSSHFAIQVAAMSKFDWVKSFIKRHKLKGQARYFAVLGKNNKPWYSIVVGSYPDKASGLKALRTLQTDKKLEGIWLRSYQDIHNALKRSPPG